jgi:hypothetical protein
MMRPSWLVATRFKYVVARLLTIRFTLIFFIIDIQPTYSCVLEMSPYAIEIGLALLLHLAHGIQFTLVFSLLLLVLNLDIHLRYNYAHIHNTDRFTFIVATSPWHRLQPYNLSFYWSSTHIFILVATVPIYTILILLDLPLQLAYGTSCNLIYFDFFHQRLVHTFTCIAIEPINKIVIILGI